MGLKTMYKWITLYMLFSIPMGIMRGIQDTETVVFVAYYIITAWFKVVLCLRFFEKAGFNTSKKLLTLGIAIILRFLFHAPWFALCIASVLFHSNQTKKLI